MSLLSQPWVKDDSRTSKGLIEETTSRVGEKIEVKKFGDILTSRPSGREAALATKAYIRLSPGEKIELDFTGVLSVGPSWLDEFLSLLQQAYGNERVICLPTDNPSVNSSLAVIR